MLMQGIYFMIDGMLVDQDTFRLNFLGMLDKVIGNEVIETAKYEISAIYCVHDNRLSRNIVYDMVRDQSCFFVWVDEIEAKFYFLSETLNCIVFNEVQLVA